MKETEELKNNIIENEIKKGEYTQEIKSEYMNREIEIIPDRTEYITCDGKVLSSIDEVMEYNRLYYELLLKKGNNKDSKNKTI